MNKKTTEEDKKKIIEKHHNGMTITELSREFNLHPKTIWWHLKMADAYQYRNKHNEIEDCNITKLVNAFFFGLISSMNNPQRLGWITREKILWWYNDVLQWADKEKFWFACWEEFCGYDESRLRNKIKTLAKQKITELKRK